MRYLEITLIVVAIIVLYSYGIKESFENMDSLSNKSLHPDKYPSDVLLADWYPKHKPSPTISKLNEEHQYKNYPIFSAHSAQNNNLRQWRKPNNGRCVRPENCGNFYENRKITLPVESKMPGFDKGVRVNYYNIN